MYSFKNDYSEGAHPRILEALSNTNMIQADGYGEDPFAEEARRLIKKEAEAPEADIHFLAGGTLTNLIALAAFMRPHEAVMAADTGHINTHETGSIEAIGHKILTRPNREGKITPQQVLDILEEHHFEHMVKPKVIYLSQPTEMGTLYSKEELTALNRLSRDKNLYLFVDGARLGSALASEANDISLAELYKLTDAFYFGGTKNGALLGEALVLKNPVVREDFRYLMKQKGGLTAKGRVLSLQFLTLFTDNLYLELAAHANRLAGKLQTRLEQLGYPMQFPSYTNQIFPILPQEVIQVMEKDFGFYRWEKIDENRWSVRLVCSWATKEEEVDRFLEKISKI